EHARTGRLAAEKADILVAVGARARAMREAARMAGMPDDATFSFDTSKEAAEALREMVGEGDVVLVKGSQSIRMERIAEALLQNEEDRGKLVRQESEWKAR
ncbi:MAG TPA: hypothetical protein VNU25_01690, partial [Candidatus Paceibacterota bacterium]|nr:hypothetical protein [Candidatus Paceibacterota bacterium]